LILTDASKIHSINKWNFPITGLPFIYSNILEGNSKYERCPKRLRHLDIQCYCPFHAGVFSVKNLAVNIPKIGGYAGSFVKVRVSIFN
jgi:hypothetical protein